MVIILMGVSGSGKTTVGRLLAAELCWDYYDADDFHPEANVEKMRSGVPLSDDDRKPWLESLRTLILGCLERNESAVLACSALKENYREYLLAHDQVGLVYLKGDYALIKNRLDRRCDHYMNPGLLGSQFETLEEPAKALQVDVASSPAEIVKAIRSGLGV